MKRSLPCLVVLLLFLGASTCLASQARTQGGLDMQAAKQLLTRYKIGGPVPTHAPRLLRPGPPRSIFAVQDTGMVVRTMPGSTSGDLNGTSAPYTWPSRALVLWGRVDGGTAPYSFKWEYGDGSAPDSGAVDESANRHSYFIAVAHTYATAGPKTARLTVYDALGHPVSRDLPLYVQPFTDTDTEMRVRRNAAIQDGLRWLYLQQQSDGSFPSSGYWYSVPSTAAALASFEIRGHYASNDPVADVYAEFVRKGLDFLFSSMVRDSIYEQPYGNPDSNGDTYGIYPNEYFADGPQGGGGGGCDSYTQGLVMYALALSREPNAVADSGGVGIAGRTYREILTNMMDQLAWSQGDNDSTMGGGWRYSVTSANDDADNSAVQWATIGLDAAARSQNQFGISAPAFVKQRLGYWLDYSRCASSPSGSYGYTYANYWCNQAKTASGMFAEYYVGHTASDSVELNSLAWLDAHWCDQYDDEYTCGQFYGNFYAMYAVKKALDDLGISTVGGRDWYSDDVHYLVKDLTTTCGVDDHHQVVDNTYPSPQTDGYWPTDCYVVNSYIGSTAFAILTLSPGISCDLFAEAQASPQGSCPNTPITFDGSASHTTCPDREVVQWLWDFNTADGADITHPDATGEVVVNHAGYPLPGGQTADTVQVRLWTIDRATDGGSPPDTSSSTTDVVINVQNHPPVAGLNGPFTAEVGQPIHLDACSSYDPDGQAGGGCQADSVVQYLWDIGGDGTVDFTTTKCRPDTTLTLNEEATISVVLTVKDSHGAISGTAASNLIWASYRNLSVQPNDVVFSTGNCGDSVQVCSTVNTTISGSGAAIPQTVVRFYNGEITPLNQIHADTLTNLVNGTVSQVCFKWLPPTGVFTFRVTAVVDADQQVQETSETDNRATGSLSIGSTVYAGDTDQNGLVEAKDVLSIGRFYALTGPARPSGSLNWGPQMLCTAWNPPAAAYADCDGNGVVNGLDVLGIVQNWRATTGSPGTPGTPPSAADREQICFALIQMIDASPPSEGLRAARDVLVSYLKDNLHVSLDFKLEPNSPDPFRDATTWRFSAPASTQAEMSVYDVTGKLVWRSVMPNVPVGFSTIRWDGTSNSGAHAPSGIYFYRFAAGSYRTVGKMMVVR